jgi:hypothetical protein
MKTWASESEISTVFGWIETHTCKESENGLLQKEQAHEGSKSAQ